MTLLELAKKFPDEQAAWEWFEWGRWHGERTCPHCQSPNTKTVPNEKPMPYWCSTCHHYFSVRTNTAMEYSRLPLKKWAWAFYLMAPHPKGLSSCQMAKHLGVRQRTAWLLTIESLRKEKYLHLARVSEYATSAYPNQLFVERIENILSRQNEAWSSTRMAGDEKQSES